MPGERTLTESRLLILKKEKRHNFPILSFCHMLTSKVIGSLIVGENRFLVLEWVPCLILGLCNLGESGRKIWPVGNTRMLYLRKKKIDIFFSELWFNIHSAQETYFQSVLDSVQREP